jgi:DNA-binding beta-propeller fold protein YncE
MVPSSVAVDASGNVYVADTYQSTIQKFNSSGAFVLSWAIANNGSGTYNFLADLAVDSSQNVNVVEEGYNIIQTFSPTGGLLATHGNHGNCCGAFTSPCGIAMDGTTLFVTDHDNSLIQKFSMAWAYQSAFNGAAFGVVSGGGDQVYVTKPESNLLQQLGGYYETCGGTGSGNGQLNQPHGIAMDGSGRIYVADTGNNRIEIFSPASGQTAPAYLDQIPLYQNTSSPYDVTLDASGNIYVADTRNYRVLKFGPL